MKKALVALALVSTLALTGCGRAGAAATIGETNIPESRVQSLIDSIISERSHFDTSGMQLATGAELNRSQVRFIIITTLFDEIAKELKISVTPGELISVRNNVLAQVGGEAQLPQALVSANIAPASLDPFLRMTVISDKIRAGLIANGIAEADVDTTFNNMISQKAQQLKIQINPRYGEWNPSSGEVVASTIATDVVATLK